MPASPLLETCFFFLGSCGENISETIDVCGIWAFWWSWIPFYPNSEVRSSRGWKNAGVLRTAWRNKTSPFTIVSLLHTSFPHNSVRVCKSTRSPFIPMGISMVSDVFAKPLLPFFSFRNLPPVWWFFCCGFQSDVEFYNLMWLKG